MAFTKIVLTGTRDLIATAFGRVNTLIDDLLSTVSGKGASQIGLEDSAGNLTAENVEAGIAELYTALSGFQALADTFDEDPATTSGTTWGWKAGLAFLNGVFYSITAGTISLTDDSENYLEINSSGTVTKNTTGWNNTRIPIRQITVASGVQTASTDKRPWFSAVTLATASSSGMWPLVNGLAKRAKFSWKDADEIYINAGVYHHLGTSEQLVYWHDQLTFQFGSGGTNADSSDLANNDWFYLYLDDSAIVTAGVPELTETELVAVTTEPTWSNTKQGWYSGNDRCIGAFFTGGTANILEFFHEGSLFLYADQILEIDNDGGATWTDAVLTLPKFVTETQITLDFGTYGAGSGEARADVRTNGQAGTTGHFVTRAYTNIKGGNTLNMITDSNQTIEYKVTVTCGINIYTDGWYFPIGL